MGTDQKKYKDGHAVIEEVATEVLSRRLTHPVFEREPGSYQKNIDAVLAELERLGAESPRELLVSAARSYKSAKYNANRSLIGHFAEAVGKHAPDLDTGALSSFLLGLKI
jgi:hypothetical protein